MLNRLSAVLFLSLLILVSGHARGAEDPQSLLDKGKAALEAGLNEEAATVFSRLIETQPQASAFYYRGLAYSASDRDALALQDFDRAASMEPDQAVYQLRRGISQNRTGNYEDSVKSLTRVLALDSENVQAFSQRAKAYFNLGQSSLALEDLTQAVKRNPNNAGLYKLRGDILSSLGEHDSAIQDYDIAIRLKPHDPASHNNRGIALANLGKVKEAVDDLNKAMDIAASTPAQVHVPGISGNPW